MKILITGANGFVGAALCRYFYAQGHEITALGRRQLAPAALHHCARYICADITRPLPPFGEDVCIHAAALASDTANYDDLYRSNVMGTGHVLEAARHCRTFIQISSSSVYAFGPEPAREEDAVLFAKLSPYGKTKLLAEQLVSAAIPGKQQRLILRPRAIYGPGDRLLLPRLLRMVKGKYLLCPAPAGVQTSLTHIDNLSRAIALFLEKCTAPGCRIYNVADGPVYDLRWIITTLLKEVYGYPLSVVDLPPGLLQALARVNGWFAGNSQLTPMAVAALTRDSVLDTSLIEKHLNYRPQETFATSYTAIADWVRDLGGTEFYLNNLPEAPWQLESATAAAAAVP